MVEPDPCVERLHNKVLRGRVPLVSPATVQVDINAKSSPCPPTFEYDLVVKDIIEGCYMVVDLKVQQ